VWPGKRTLRRLTDSDRQKASFNLTDTSGRRLSAFLSVPNGRIQLAYGFSEAVEQRPVAFLAARDDMQCALGYYSDTKHRRSSARE
jgi:hypothetical protein